MQIITLQVGPIGTNCYIVYSEHTRQAAVIDPGGNAEDILAELKEQQLTVLAIINTHGHADHIMANTKLREVTQAPLYIHSADAPMLLSARLNLSQFLGMEFTCEPADQLLSEGDKITIGEFVLTVVHTPGHTPGGISLLTDQIVFSGDTLFAESVGRTDFPGGSQSQIVESVKNKLLILDDAVKVLPGHGPGTTIGWERTHNPYIQ
ncbi:MAG: MBL fold metallo-hydrolase [Pelosinus sp.]|nr:MBL fold metallo-hydrolase [Pelosinus sp.]